MRRVTSAKLVLSEAVTILPIHLLRLIRTD
jgi:hypothetical protein